jgi:hypothetical protein
MTDDTADAPTIVTEVAPLWTRRDLAKFLQCSPRWIHTALATPPDEKGSIPYVELPSSGSRRQVRFIPDVIREWVRRGCPDVQGFQALHEDA